MRPPDATLRRRTQLLLGGRLLVATLLFGGVLLLAEGHPTGSFTQLALSGLVALTYATSLAGAVMLQLSQSPSRVAGFQIALDLLTVTGLVYLLGGAQSGFTSLYGVVVLSSALVIGARATRVTTAWGIALFLALALGGRTGLVPPPPDQPLIFELNGEVLALALLRNLVGLILVGVLAGTLAERLRRTGGELQAATASAAEYARLNEDILRSMMTGLMTCDLKGTITLINPAGAEVFGGDAKEVEGRAARSLLPIDPVDRTEVERGDGSATRIDGTRFPIGYNCSPLRDADDRVLGTLVIFQDLSELITLREKAERAERLAALGRLAAGLAHEIRNPLGSISGSVEMVREAESLSDEDRRLLTLVLGEVDRLNDLVTTMLEVGRPKDPIRVSLDFAALARDIARVAERDGTGGARVEVSPVPENAPHAYADPAQMRQVLWNLVKNARQFSPPTGVVRITVENGESGFAVVTVKDEGPGIAEEDIEHLFDMFFTKRQHGVGLGLALVRQIVEAHRGTVQVENDPEGGAMFRIRIPAAPSVLEPAAGLVSQPQAPHA